MGSYDPETVTFRLAEAVGPFRLDMGDTVYAPNLQEDAKGRCILWAWVQERRSVGKYDFAGCMASPRVLLRRRGRLIQQPLPELAQVPSVLCSRARCTSPCMPYVEYGNADQNAAYISLRKCVVSPQYVLPNK